MSDERKVIKKYPNRRLYDGGARRHITLEDIKKMTVGGENFCVRDAKSGEDITRSVLLQALLADGEGESPALSEQALRNLVALFHGPGRGPMAAYLEQILPLFLEMQKKTGEQFGRAMPVADMEKVAAVQGMMARRVMEQYVVGGMENFFRAHEQMRDNARKMMGDNGFFPPSAADFFSPPDKK